MTPNLVVVSVTPGEIISSNIVQLLHIFIFRLIEHLFRCRKGLLEWDSEGPFTSYVSLRCPLLTHRLCWSKPNISSFYKYGICSANVNRPFKNAHTQKKHTISEYVNFVNSYCIESCRNQKLQQEPKAKDALISATFLLFLASPISSISKIKCYRSKLVQCCAMLCERNDGNVGPQMWTECRTD